MGNGAPVTHTHLFPSSAHTMSGKTEDELKHSSISHKVENRCDKESLMTDKLPEGREAVVSCDHNQA